MGWVLGSRGQHSCGILILRHTLRVISPLLRSFFSLAVGGCLYLGRTLLQCVPPTYIICVLRQVHDCVRVMSCKRIVSFDDHETLVQETRIKGVPMFMDELSERTRSSLFKTDDPNNGADPIGRGRFPFNRKYRCVQDANNGFIYFFRKYACWLYIYERCTDTCGIVYKAIGIKTCSCKIMLILFVGIYNFSF